MTLIIGWRGTHEAVADTPGQVRRQHKRVAPPLPVLWFGIRDRQGEKGDPHPLKATTQKKATRMTSHNRRASSVRLAPVRSEPDIVLIASCPTRQVVLSTNSLAANRRPVYRGEKENITAAAASAISRARAEHQETGLVTAAVINTMPFGLPGGAVT